MTPAQRAGLVAGALLCTGAASACELLLVEHRSGQLLARAPLDRAAPTAQVAFTHSVLGTPVADQYVWRAAEGGWRAHLVEERFEGQGYGLPASAGSGESLQRDGDGWRLVTDRVVDPLVVRPLPAQRMRVLIDGQPPLLLGSLSMAAIELRAQACPGR